jgi:hypothetical protein
MAGRKKTTTSPLAGRKKTTTSPLDTVQDQKVLAVQFNRRELDVLREALEGHHARGSRVTVSQLIRWAVSNVDFDQMP